MAFSSYARNAINNPSPAAAAAQQEAARRAASPLQIDNQAGAARQLGQGMAAQGRSIFAGQQQTAQGLQNQGNAYQASAQSITGAPMGGAAPGRPAASPAGFSGTVPMPGQNSAGYSTALAGATRPAIAGQAAPAAPQPAFQTGSQIGAQNYGSVANVNPASLGGYGSVAGGLGAAPGAVSTAGLGSPGGIAGQLGGYSTVAGGLGGGYQVGSVGNVAGRLGAAPQVGQVGNIQTGAAPGAVAGQLGTMGQSSADQQSMLGRLNAFLDAPEGPSVAEAQLRQAQADNMGQLIGMARSGRGGAGAQAQALQGALSEGGAIASDTAGQLATLRAQEEDMRRNRALSAIGLGGEMATAARGQDLSYRGQDLSALQGDQSTQLGARGQDLSAAMANQSTQTQLEQLRAQTALGARGQDLSALQGDQSTALGLEGLRANTAVSTRGQDLQALLGDQSASIAARGQNLGALQSDQATQLATRGQDISVLQGNQQTALGARGQDLGALSADQQAAIAARGQNLSALQGNQQAGLTTRGQDIQATSDLNAINTTRRGQDLSALTSDADRNLAAQQLSLQGQLGFGGLANDARGQGLNYLSQANQQAMMGEGMAQDAINNTWNLRQSGWNAQIAADAGLQAQAMANNAQPSFWERLALAGVGAAGSAGGGLLGNAALMSDERVKTDIAPVGSGKHRSIFADAPLEARQPHDSDSLADHLRGAPGYRYRYREGFGEDAGVEHAGPMAQDLERGPFGKALVKQGPDGIRRVDTARLSLVNHAALSSMRSELDRLKQELAA